MPDDAGTDYRAAGGHAGDGGPGTAATGQAEVTSVNEKQLRLLFTIPILLGLFICALNLLVITRLWRAVYFSNIGLLSRANLPNTMCFALITISFAIGLALIVYAIALRHYEEWYEQRADEPGETPQEGTPHRLPRRVPLYLKWVLGPFLIALPAPALTVWAASIVEPVAPRPCIDMYAEALKIKKDNPEFKVVWNDRDQLRCSINQVLEQ